jgi:hypothetical protein
MDPTAHRFPTATVAEVAWRRECLLRAAARSRRRRPPGRAGLGLRQRIGLGLVAVGLAVAGRLTTATVTDLGRAAAPQA